jgi:hypothetical protein
VQRLTYSVVGVAVQRDPNQDFYSCPGSARKRLPAAPEPEQPALLAASMRPRRAA